MPTLVRATHGVVGALREQCPESKIDMCGNSVGSFIAIAYANKHPDMVDSLITTGAAPCPPFGNITTEALRPGTLKGVGIGYVTTSARARSELFLGGIDGDATKADRQADLELGAPLALSVIVSVARQAISGTIGRGGNPDDPRMPDLLMFLSDDDPFLRGDPEERVELVERTLDETYNGLHQVMRIPGPHCPEQVAESREIVHPLIVEHLLRLSSAS
jgi:pimeloyl-ACP methyl ester carboxylesterase